MDTIFFKKEFTMYFHGNGNEGYVDIDTPSPITKFFPFTSTFKRIIQTLIQNKAYKSSRYHETYYLNESWIKIMQTEL